MTDKTYVSITRMEQQTMFALETNDSTFTLDELISHIKYVAEHKLSLWNQYVERRGVAGGQGVIVPKEERTSDFTGPRSLRLREIIPEIYVPNKPLQIADTEMSGVEAGYVKVLLYDMGCEFGWHCDSETREVDELELVSSNNWVQHGTLIILPPKSVCQYEGGELEFGCSTFTAHETFWTYVVIPFGVKHRVSRVSSGKRIVFKTLLYRGIQPKMTKDKETLPSSPEYFMDGPVD